MHLVIFVLEANQGGEYINRLQNIGYPFRNDFTKLSFNFRNGDGTGNKKSFPVSLPSRSIIKGYSR